MNKAFYNKVINLIPSRDLKSFVKSSDFKFTEKDLLKIIIDYSYDMQEKLQLLEAASRELDGKEERTLAKRRITFEKKIYAAFVQDSPDTVYETIIKTEPNAYEETYITTTFENALLMIKSFLKCYDVKAKECAYARYTIKKKTTNLPNKPSDIYNNKVGILGECVLDKKFRVLYLYLYGAGQEVTCKRGATCDECLRCIEYTDTHFPHFLDTYELVAYYDDLINNPTHLTYGIFDLNMEKYESDSHVVLIEGNEYIQKRRVDFQDENGYYRVYDEHDHPSYFEIIRPDLSEVPQHILDDYAYAVEGLKKLNGDD